MAFKMTCPKCGTYDYSVERDVRAGFHNDDTFALVFACRCGKQLFGQQILDEHERQKAIWEARAAARARAGDRAPTETRDRLGGYLRHRGDEDEHDHEHEHHVSEDERCEWQGCTNVRRPNSKYCSRACSNKNARQRYKKRHRSESREAA